MDGLTIVTFPTCGQCRLLKKILEKYNINYNEIEHGSPIENDYPVIYYNNEELSYNEFMKKYKMTRGET